MISDPLEQIRGGTTRHLFQFTQTITNDNRNTNDNNSSNNKLSSDDTDELKIDLLFLEDFDAKVDNLFISTELKPYFKGIFADLALRSTSYASDIKFGKSMD